MPSVVPNPKTIRPFASEAAFEAWLKKNHASATEVWIKMFKKHSGKASIDWNEAVDVALCWGWIDGIRKTFDDEAFLQRYTPRRAKSRWSQINVARVKRLIKAGRMTPHGQLHVDAARSDGRWDAAYPSPSTMEVSVDFLSAISTRPAALKAYRAFKRQQTFALAYRLHHLKSPERRAKLIAEVIAALTRGENPFPGR